MMAAGKKKSHQRLSGIDRNREMKYQCLTKIKFDSKELADRAVESAPKLTHSYRCRVCRKWHTSTSGRATPGPSAR